MRMDPLPVHGAFVVTPETRSDQRGWFSRLFSDRELTVGGAPFRVAQLNRSFSERRGTLRGLHHQTPPFEEAKLLMCTRGVLFDAIADVRPGSDTFGRWAGTVLEAGDGRLVFVPPGCAHGLLSLTDDCEAIYLTSNDFSAEHERVLRWDDPFFAIAWPIAPAILSDKDRAAPDFVPPQPGLAAAAVPAAPWRNPAATPPRAG